MKSRLSVAMTLVLSFLVLLCSCGSFTQGRGAAVATACVSSTKSQSSRTATASTATPSAGSDTTTWVSAVQTARTAAHTSASMQPQTTKASVSPTSQVRISTIPKPSVQTAASSPTLTPVVDEPISSALTPLSPQQYYGRQLLAGEGNPRLLSAYEHIAASMEQYARTIDISHLRLSVAEAQKAYAYYLDDYPQHFWRSGNYSLSVYEDENHRQTVAQITPDYTFGSDAAVRAARTEMHAALQEILHGVTADMSDYERELLLHDRLVTRIIYDADRPDDPHIFTMYGALINGRAVCEGYARAFQYLMYQAGIPCMIAKGVSDNPDGEPVGHAWNVVKIDGAYYHLDATWNDPVIEGGTSDDIRFYYYFNLTTEEIQRDHEIYSAASDGSALTYPLPACTATKYNYYIHSNAVIETAAIQPVAEAIAGAANAGRRYVNLRVPDAGAFWESFFLPNFPLIRTQANALISPAKNRISAAGVSCFYNIEQRAVVLCF